MQLPPSFVHTIHNIHGIAGNEWLNQLPYEIQKASSLWDLTDIKPLPNLSYNFVATAKRASHSGFSDVILKMGLPHAEIRSEMVALRLLNHTKTCQLIANDKEKCWLLLERVMPGAQLANLKNDDEATHIAAEVMKSIWLPVKDLLLKNEANDHQDITNSLIRLSDWFDGLKRLRKMFNDRTGPLNQKLVSRVERSVKEFFTEDHEPVLMHGDLHHYNILLSQRGWLAIDPKGVIGPAGYEVGPFMMNPRNINLNGSRFKVQAKRRIDILHEHLDFERERIIEWSLAHAVLSAWWSFEENGDWKYAKAISDALAEIK